MSLALESCSLFLPPSLLERQCLSSTHLSPDLRYLMVGKPANTGPDHLPSEVPVLRNSQWLGLWRGGGGVWIPENTDAG